MVVERLGTIANLWSSPARRDALARLLTSADLPGSGWRKMSEKTWPTGAKGPATEWSERARAAGSLTAFRSLQNRGVRQWIWTQMTPLVSMADAHAELERMRERGLRTQGAVRVHSEKDVAVDLFAGSTRIWAHEQRVTGLFGNGTNKLLAAVVGTSVIVVSSSGTEVITWSAMAGLAVKLGQRVPTELT
ncbi:MAG TPA: hypothetical protein VG247_33910 [Pseudonocardiaceae bacterium]|nr:hypothetical protein [Pseudonocardiaceae bacterium]